ncbi:hypothetical protein TELCIR_17634, partial [Teladorsagia circumcincta]
DVLGLIKASGLKPVVISVAPPPEPAAAAPSSGPSAPQKAPAKQSIPHGYQSATVQADTIMAIQAELQAKGVDVPLNSFIIKAAALALRENMIITSFTRHVKPSLQSVVRTVARGQHFLANVPLKKRGVDKVSTDDLKGK